MLRKLPHQALNRKQIVWAVNFLTLAQHWLNATGWSSNFWRQSAKLLEFKNEVGRLPTNWVWNVIRHLSDSAAKPPIRNNAEPHWTASIFQNLVQVRFGLKTLLRVSIRIIKFLNLPRNRLPLKAAQQRKFRKFWNWKTNSYRIPSKNTLENYF